MIYDSSRNNHPYLVSHTKLIVFRSLWAFVLVTNLCLACCFSQEKNISDNITVVFERQKAAYIVAQPEGTLERRMVEYLSGYLTQVTSVPAVTVSSVVQVDAKVSKGQFILWPKERCDDRFGRLIKQGLLVPASDGKYRLADWENWAQK